MLHRFADTYQISSDRSLDILSYEGVPYTLSHCISDILILVEYQSGRSFNDNRLKIPQVPVVMLYNRPN
jgi:hypothetical protein